MSRLIFIFDVRICQLVPDAGYRLILTMQMEKGLERLNEEDYDQSADAGIYLLLIHVSRRRCESGRLSMRPWMGFRDTGILAKSLQGYGIFM